METPTRAAAHTLLDLFSSMQSGNTIEQERAFEVSMQRLNEAEAFTGTQSEEGLLSLDLTPILIATGISYVWLFEQLADATGRSIEELTFDLRAFVDRYDG